MKINVDRNDLEKIFDCLRGNAMFHLYRDRMNSELHMAKEVRLSPLTSETLSAKDRLMKMLGFEDPVSQESK